MTDVINRLNIDKIKDNQDIILKEVEDLKKEIIVLKDTINKLYEELQKRNG